MMSADTAMLDPPLMYAGPLGDAPLDVGVVGAQFEAMATASPLTAMPEQYPALGGGSTLTEFTKRRNWSQRILEELQDFLHVLSPAGKIVYASPSSRALTGYSPDELMNKFITNFIHDDDSAQYVMGSLCAAEPRNL